MITYKTEQEEFWAGDFGNKYIGRNKDKKAITKNLNLFSKIFENTTNIKSVLEFDANIGLNLHAIKTLLPDVNISAVEINNLAIKILKKISSIKVYHQSILDFDVKNKADFVFTKGVLIHINPDKLNLIYEKLYNTSNKYICIAEYYNPQPIAIKYRGYENKLFKRDFAGELLDKYKNLELIKYGFIYHRDTKFPLDDISWFLLEKYI